MLYRIINHIEENYLWNNTSGKWPPWLSIYIHTRLTKFSITLTYINASEFHWCNVESPPIKHTWLWVFCNRSVILNNPLKRKLMVLNNIIYLEISLTAIEVFYGLLAIQFHRKELGYHWSWCLAPVTVTASTGLEPKRSRWSSRWK